MCRYQCGHRGDCRLVRAKDPEWGDKKSVVAWQHPLIESLNLPAALSEQEVPVFFTDLQETDAESLRRRIIDSYIGITAADFCMADTATLVMRTRAGARRARFRWCRQSTLRLLSSTGLLPT